MTRTVVFGLDGITFDIVDRHRDRLSNIDRLVDTGTRAVLQSTKPPITSVAWPGFATGQNPGRYGIFDFMSRDPETLNFHLNDVRKKRTDFFWEHMDESIGIASVPMVPYHSVDGFFVQGSLARINQDRITSPPELGAKIPEAYDYTIDFDAEEEEDILDGARERVRAREELFVDLVSNTDLDLYFLMFSVLDHVQHHFWAHYDESHPAHRPTAYQSTIPDMYERVDEAVGRILSQFDEEVNVIIASDHGFGPRRWDVNVNAILSQAGYLTYRSDAKTSFGRVARSCKELIKGTRLSSLIPNSVRSAASQQIPEKEDFGDAVDWGRTTAYSFGASGNVYLNLEEREKNGTVAAEEYESVREDVATLLRNTSNEGAASDPIRSVEYGENVYDGRYSRYSPDIVVNYNAGYHPRSNLGSTIHSEYDELGPNTGHHEPEGVFVASGPDFRSRELSSPLSIHDIAPTLLHLYGYDLPESMDGTVAADCLAMSEPVTHTPSSKPERRRVADRVLTLKQLGRI